MTSQHQSQKSKGRKSLQEEILIKLKYALKDINKQLNNSSFLQDINNSLKGFYLRNTNDNLFEKPIPGQKFDKRINAIRSSAAMIFNLLGQKDITIDGVDYNAAKYERGYYAINDKIGRRHKAYLDAVFFSKDTKHMVAIETKMLEWLDVPKKLMYAYLDKEKYIVGNDQICQFIHFFKTLIKDDKDLKPQTKVYDAIQMTIHILSLYNLSCSIEKPPKTITLYNVVWNYKCDRYVIEEEEGENYVKKANEYFRPIFKKREIEFNVEYCTFSAFKQKIKLSKERAVYLKRYDIE